MKYCPQDIKAWAQSRETSDEIAMAIFEIADEGDEDRMWQSPTDDETASVTRQAWELNPEADILQWGVETIRK